MTISAYMVAKVQPMKLAAMEALYNGGTDQGLTAVAWVNPVQQNDYKNQKEVPNARLCSLCTFVACHSFIARICAWCNDLIKGYTREDGTRELSVAEKLVRGKMAVNALMGYRAAKKDGRNEAAKKYLAVLKPNMKYFGYGYVESADQLVPFYSVGAFGRSG